NVVTRGQACKVVVLAFDISPVCPSKPSFVDVPPDYPFYCHIETAAAAGLIGGYDDGTFHPGNPVTRGQLCKITTTAGSVTRGWVLVNPLVPSFTDVPRGSAFYRYVETAVCRRIAAGYDDGTFRPGAASTRGQASKILYKAVTSFTCELPVPIPTPTRRPGAGP